MGLAYSVRERLIDRWLKTQQMLSDMLAKRSISCRLSSSRALSQNYLISLGMEEEARSTLQGMGFDLDELEEEEWDAGLGNGGLGRLASCYMDSMAAWSIPVTVTASATTTASSIRSWRTAISASSATTGSGAGIHGNPTPETSWAGQVLTGDPSFMAPRTAAATGGSMRGASWP